VRQNFFSGGSFRPLNSPVELGAAPSGANFDIAEKLCMILDAKGEDSDPRAGQVYQEEFNRWYGKLQNIDWKEREVLAIISKRCPTRMVIFNRFRGELMAKEQDDIQQKKRESKGILRKLPPAGRPVWSVDRPRPGQVIPQPGPVKAPPTPAPLPAQPVSVAPQATPTPYSRNVPTQSSQDSRYNLTPMSMRTQPSEGSCPSGQFRPSPGAPCRGSVGAMPGIPGGMDAGATMAPGGFSTPSVPSTSVVSMSGRSLALRMDSMGPGYTQTYSPSRRGLGQKLPPPPGVCCQKDARGNTICSDGKGYSPN
jgi:hypothetical protein